MVCKVARLEIGSEDREGVLVRRGNFKGGRCFKVKF